MRGVVIVKLYMKFFEISYMLGINPFYKLLGSYAFGTGTNHHRRAVRVVGAKV